MFIVCFVNKYVSKDLSIQPTVHSSRVAGKQSVTVSVGVAVAVAVVGKMDVTVAVDVAVGYFLVLLSAHFKKCSELPYAGFLIYTLKFL